MATTSLSHYHSCAAAAFLVGYVGFIRENMAAERRAWSGGRFGAARRDVVAQRNWDGIPRSTTAYAAVAAPAAGRRAHNAAGGSRHFSPSAALCALARAAALPACCVTLCSTYPLYGFGVCRRNSLLLTALGRFAWLLEGRRWHLLLHLRAPCAYLGSVILLPAWRMGDAAAWCFLGGCGRTARLCWRAAEHAAYAAPPPILSIPSGLPLPLKRVNRRSAYAFWRDHQRAWAGG